MKSILEKLLGKDTGINYDIYCCRSEQKIFSIMDRYGVMKKFHEYQQYLTSQEKEILQLYSRGYSERYIARKYKCEAFNISNFVDEIEILVQNRIKRQNDKEIEVFKKQKDKEIRTRKDVFDAYKHYVNFCIQEDFSSFYEKWKSGKRIY